MNKNSLCMEAPGVSRLVRSSPRYVKGVDARSLHGHFDASNPALPVMKPLARTHSVTLTAVPTACQVVEPAQSHQSGVAMVLRTAARQIFSHRKVLPKLKPVDDYRSLAMFLINNFRREPALQLSQLEFGTN
ncbi:hypothetical protein [Ideonella sp.]|uniref:hypothetical protein n=1 Tax=Ideonella sp. TaxID=1929293 RepID=UPI002D7E4BFD|nr:hypothetical protein [Ideonella sp.]